MFWCLLGMLWFRVRFFGLWVLVLCGVFVLLCSFFLLLLRWLRSVRKCLLLCWWSWCIGSWIFMIFLLIVESCFFMVIVFMIKCFVFLCCLLWMCLIYLYGVICLKVFYILCFWSCFWRVLFVFVVLVSCGC